MLEIFNYTTQDWHCSCGITTVSCYEDMDFNKTKMTSCMMHVDYPIQPKEIALMRITYPEKPCHELLINSTEISEGDSIGSEEDIKLTFKGADADQSILTFE